MADHNRLDQAIEARRLDLGLSWIQLARAAGISDVSLRNFRKGRGNPNALSKRRLETALHWRNGSIDAILDGGQPIVSSGGTGAHTADATPEELRQFIADLRDEIQHLDVRYERNRPLLVAHLQRQIQELQDRLDSLRNGE